MMNSLFVYGSLKSDEIAFKQFADLVEEIRPAKLFDYEVGIRDGLPVIFESKGEFVEGELLTPKIDSMDTFWTSIERYEGSDLYKKAEVKVLDQEGDSWDCLTFAGKREKARGYSKIDGSRWTSKYDPYFAYSFPILLESISKMKRESFPADMPKQYWLYMNSMQEKYLLLTVILEHIALLVVGMPDETGPNARIKKLGETPEWALAYEKMRLNPGITIIQVKDAKKLKYKYDNQTPEDAIKTYYQIRSNLSHQGKSGGYADCDLMYASLVDLAGLLKEYLKIAIADIENGWSYLKES
jgi:gamma-glutamylcyclotransferase (GGCT)/AIG2-like uncharacterized protein YtfP